MARFFFLDIGCMSSSVVATPQALQSRGLGVPRYDQGRAGPAHVGGARRGGPDVPPPYPEVMRALEPRRFLDFLHCGPLVGGGLRCRCPRCRGRRLLRRPPWRVWRQGVDCGGGLCHLHLMACLHRVSLDGLDTDRVMDTHTEEFCDFRHVPWASRGCVRTRMKKACVVMPSMQGVDPWSR